MFLVPPNGTYSSPKEGIDTFVQGTVVQGDLCVKNIQRKGDVAWDGIMPDEFDTIVSSVNDAIVTTTIK